MGEDGNVKYD